MATGVYYNPERSPRKPWCYRLCLPVAWGKPIQEVKLFYTEEQAVQARKERKKELKRGKVSLVDFTYEKWIPWYSKRVQGHALQVDVSRMRRHILEGLGRFPVVSLDARRIDRFLRGRKEKVSIIVCMELHRLLTSVLELAQKKKLMRYNACDGVALFRSSEAKPS